MHFLTLADTLSKSVELAAQTLSDAGRLATTLWKLMGIQINNNLL